MAKHQDNVSFGLTTDAYSINLEFTHKKPVFCLKAISTILAFSFAVSLGCFSHSVYAESSSTKNYNIPASSLSKGLSQFAGKNGINLSFDPALTEGKQTSGLKGEFGVVDGFHELLKDSGLHIVNDAKGGYFLEKAPTKPTPPVSQNSGHVDVELSKVKIRAKRFKQVGPMPGLELTKEQIAGNIQSVTAKEIKESHSLSLSDLLNSKLQSVNVNDYQGNPFQMDVTYRGFTAGPQIGTPQGLSVFFDGVRVNEPFGDVVNWDMIPMNALDGIDIYPGSNPLFGLNTLGGALSMKTKSGFTSPGISAEILAGSYGRKQLQASGGWNNANKEEGSWDGGDYAAFGAVNLFLEDGWRKNSPSKVNQAFGKLEWQGERASLALSALGVTNKLVGNGTVPQEFYNQDPTSVFTSPDKTDNTLLQFSLSGVFDVTDNFNVTGRVYNRNSNRHANTGDVIDQESFNETLGDFPHYATRLPGKEKDLVCAYTDDNRDGIPNYYTYSEADLNKIQNSGVTSAYNLDPTIFKYNDTDVPDELTASLKKTFTIPVYDVFLSTYYTDPSDKLPLGNFATEFFYFPVNQGVQYIANDGSTRYAIAADPVNRDKCATAFYPLYPGSSRAAWIQWALANKPLKARDGAHDNGSGVVEGTPTAIITDSDIQQSTKGAALQLNWNLDEHKFMVGASIDKSYASYVGKQRLGLMDNDRNVFNDPSLLGDEYFYASHDGVINDFSGTSRTKSAYFSETWTPTQTLNLSFSGRYNYTDVVNKLAPTKAERNLTNIRAMNRYVFGIICPGGDTANCPYSIDGPMSADEWKRLLNSRVAGADPINLLDKSATEKFNFHSLNPAVGATWQAKPNLNLYANWNQGTRTPSVIELGCAYDGTLVYPKDDQGNDIVGQGKFPRSLAEGRGCKLPSSLSGDPFLPQVIAQTMEVGARGKFNDFIEWNVSAYRTNVKDDIYMTSLTSDLSFFQSIGDTRRQGIEFGLAGEYGKSDFRVNYSLTEATFESYFKTFAPNNSSRSISGEDFNQIQVRPGNVMPGVPFNNLNVTWGYKVNPDLKINLSLVGHSRSFLRGNENNAHTPTPSRLNSNGQALTLPNEYSGTAPGYAVLNFNGRYNIGKGWATSVLVNNLLDKKYYTAGRLGSNPFAPSTIGAIGPGGFNYNSNEWISSQLISPGAPRGIWVALNYDFDATKKSEPPVSNISMTEPDRTLDEPTTLPTAEEQALIKMLDNIKALPVLKLKQVKAHLATKTAEQEVKASVETWRNALAVNDADAFVKSYSSTFAPAGLSHNKWEEDQKLKLVTNSTSAVEVSDLVVAAQGQRMVAVFVQKLTNNQEQVVVRKVLTFEQKEGQWQIIREHALPLGNVASQPADAPIPAQSQPKASQLAPDSHKQVRNKLIKLSKADGLNYAEVK